MKTLKLRIKDNYTRWLPSLANEVNFVWNYVNDLSYKTIKNKGKWLSAYDMHPYLVGATKQGLSIFAQTIKEIAEQYCVRRVAAKKRKLRWRKSAGPKKSLGWVPFKTGNVRLKGNILYYGKNKFKVWDSYGLENYKLRAGSFNQDSQGHWYLNVCVDTQDTPTTGMGEVGIDLGLKDFASFSNGQKIDTQQFYRKQELKLAKAQRAKKTKQVKAIHAKIKNKRKDFLHKLSTGLIKENNLIVVGNVNSSKLAKTNMAKSVLDAGWGMFRTMLEYKAIRRQATVLVVNEAYSSSTCSSCKSGSGPKGLVGLGIREWECSDCKTVQDRDTNAALNILASGYRCLAVGVSVK